MKIPHSKPYFDSEDKETLNLVLQSCYVSNGPLAQNLGMIGAKILDKNWGIATQSGTDALTSALFALSLKEGTKVLIPAYVCAALLDALSILKLVPRVIDIDKFTLGISTDLVNEDKSSCPVIAAHLFGIPSPYWKISKRVIIEDCAQTLDVFQDDSLKKVGSTGDLAICSFYATKLLTTGHGGLVAGNDIELQKNINKLLNHDKQEEKMFHLHYHMSDLNAALGITQFKKLSFFIAERRKIARRYDKALSLKVRKTSSIFSRYLVASNDTDNLLLKFHSDGIDAKSPVYKPAYQYLNLSEKMFPNATWVHKHIISIPIYPGMSEKHILRIETFLEKHKDEMCCWPPA